MLAAGQLHQVKQNFAKEMSKTIFLVQSRYNIGNGTSNSYNSQYFFRENTISFKRFNRVCKVGRLS